MGTMPTLPGIFPDYLAPIVRNAPDGVRELVMARWGMPCPPQHAGQPVTNIRNAASPHWRRWLKPENRCVVPWTSFCEYADTKPKKTPTWFAPDNAPGMKTIPAFTAGDAAPNGWTALGGCVPWLRMQTHRARLISPLIVDRGELGA